MKYVITGSTGHISKPITKALVSAGHEVTVITSKHDRVKEIESLGAKAAVGSIADAGFLAKAFNGAHAVYTMVPPIYDVQDWKAYIGQIGKNYADAIKANKIKYVVNLSSMGAHLPDGAGPVSGLHRAEKALNSLADTNIIHLRPAYFYYNLFNMTGMIKGMGILGNNFSMHDKTFPIVSPSDVAAIAIDELLTLNFSGHIVQYIASDEVSTDDIASVIGKAIDKPDLKWVEFADDQATQGALQAGLPKELAENYTEMGHSLKAGNMAEDYWKYRPAVLGKVKLADFVKSFAAAYNNEAAMAAH